MEWLAYIYRYRLKNRSLQREINLMHYGDEIQNVLGEHFKENLKDSAVKGTYFEFKLFVSVPAQILQGMGRKLHRVLPINVSGFSRMKQELYALVYRSRDGEDDSLSQEQAIYVEFFDTMLLEDQNEFLRRANAFFQRSHDLKEQKLVEYPEEVIKNFYIDILNAHYSIRFFSKFLESSDEISCFIVKGFHRRHREFDEEFYGSQNRDKIRLENCPDVGFLEHRETIRKQIGDDCEGYSDFLEIHSIIEQTKLVAKIEKALSLYLAPAHTIPALSSIERGQKYIFRVHDVGQALATSISHVECNPFLYFDYGMPYGKNAVTRPSKVNMHTEPGCTIILSHLHMDHWYRIFDEYNAYMCQWFIPAQHKTAMLKHKLAEIIVSGGTVELICRDISFSCGKLTCGGTSKIKPARIAATVHETGLTLRIQASSVYKSVQECNILIPGDQEYDYIEPSQLADLDILVACHHGGRFSWSKKDTPPLARGGNEATVIYSYGIGNTYHHPTERGEYYKSKWTNEHNVCSDGEYSCLISL